MATRPGSRSRHTPCQPTRPDAGSHASRAASLAVVSRNAYLPLRARVGRAEASSSVGRHRSGGFRRTLAAFKYTSSPRRGHATARSYVHRRGVAYILSTTDERSAADPTASHAGVVAPARAIWLHPRRSASVALDRGVPPPYTPGSTFTAPTHNLEYIPMAIVKLGSMVVAASGMLGGVIFSHNKGGAYVKAFSVPTNPQTILQQDVRTDFAQLVSDWTGVLDQDDRDSWIDYAEVTPVTNALGESHLITGQNWFIRTNTPLLQAGLTPVLVAPPIGAGPPMDAVFDIVAALFGVQEYTVAFDATQPWTSVDGAAMLVYAASPTSPGSKRMDLPFRLLTTILGDSVTPPTSPVTALKSPWALQTGDRVVLEGRIVTPIGLDSGRFRSPDGLVT